MKTETKDKQTHLKQSLDCIFCMKRPTVYKGKILTSITTFVSEKRIFS